MTISGDNGIVVAIGGQTGGGKSSYEFGFVMWRVLRDAAAQVRLKSLDPRVQEFAILLRVSGNIVVFEGDDVENVRFGRHRSYISVDWLFKEGHTQIRDIDQLTALVTLRLRRMPSITALMCRKRAVAIDETRLSSECEQIAEHVDKIASDLGRFEQWKLHMIEIERGCPVYARSYLDE